MQHWPSLDWWTHRHGYRTVPVELGTDSTDKWKETTMLIHTFMSDFMHPSVCQEPEAEVAYIAQHPLFDQLPSLTGDFEQPALMGGEAVQMNAWIGTQGTVTPLHYDSYDNFLAQVTRIAAMPAVPCLLVMQCGCASHWLASVAAIYHCRICGH